MRRTSQGWVFLSAIGLLLCLFPTPALADTVSDTFTVYSPNGSVFQTTSLSDSQEANLDFIFVAGVSPDPSQANNATQLLNADGSLSDIFGVIFTETGAVVLAFWSDAPGDPAPIDNFFRVGISLPEGSGGPFDATMYLDPTLRSEGYTATFTSGAPAPEPPSFILLGAGFLALAGIVLRQKHLHVVSRS